MLIAITIVITIIISKSGWIRCRIELLSHTKLSKWVKKGESSIPILAPLLSKEELEDEHGTKNLVRFKFVCDFDVAQIEVEHLQEPPKWKVPDRKYELNQRLIQYANSKGISVSFNNLPEEGQGLSKGGSINIDLTARTKALVHETPHELLH